MRSYGHKVADRMKWVGILVLLAAILVRAVVPAGFMLEASAAARGELKLVICTGSGSKVVDAGASGPSSEHDQDGQGSQHEPCAFGAGATAALQPVLIDADPPEIAASSAPLRLIAFILPPVRAGPTLGSRAPPLHS